MHEDLGRPRNYQPCPIAQSSQDPQQQIGRHAIRVPVENAGDTGARGLSEPRNLRVCESTLAHRRDDLVDERGTYFNLHGLGDHSIGHCAT